MILYIIILAVIMILALFLLYIYKHRKLSKYYDLTQKNGVINGRAK